MVRAAGSARLSASLSSSDGPWPTVACPLAITRSAALARRIATATGALLENLEAFAVARAAAAAGVEFAAVLGVANRVGPVAHDEWRAHHRRASRAACTLVARWLRGAPGLRPRGASTTSGANPETPVIFRARGVFHANSTRMTHLLDPFRIKVRKEKGGPTVLQASEGGRVYLGRSALETSLREAPALGQSGLIPVPMASVPTERISRPPAAELPTEPDVIEKGVLVAKSTLAGLCLTAFACGIITTIAIGHGHAPSSVARSRASEEPVAAPAPATSCSRRGSGGSARAGGIRWSFRWRGRPRRRSSEPSIRRQRRTSSQRGRRDRPSRGRRLLGGGPRRTRRPRAQTRRAIRQEPWEGSLNLPRRLRWAKPSSVNASLRLLRRSGSIRSLSDRRSRLRFSGSPVDR